MDTKVIEPGVRVFRRRHSREFKVEVVRACSKPSISIAAIALANGLNANLVRRWVADANAREAAALAVTAGCAPPAFVPVPISPMLGADNAYVRIELQHGATTIKLAWPVDSAAQCAQWLRELLR